MIKPLRFSVLSHLGLAFGLLALLAGEVKADLTVSNIGLYGGGSTPIDPNTTIVEVQFTGNSGVWVYGDAQTATNWTNPNGSSIPLYCIDLLHDNILGSSYQLTTWTNPNSFSSDALNRVAWAADNANPAGYGAAAAQLLIWSTIDPNFKVINWNGDTALQSAYNNMVTAMNTEYNSQTNYSASFFDAVHQPSSDNQDLVVAAPEPSTMVIAGLGAVGLIAYGRRRRRRATV
jgi:MYXO-CTERM domain-containing protein